MKYISVPKQHVSHSSILLYVHQFVYTYTIICIFMITVAIVEVISDAKKSNSNVIYL